MNQQIFVKGVPKENKANGYHRKNVGVNHLAFRVSKKRRC